MELDFSATSKYIQRAGHLSWGRAEEECGDGVAGWRTGCPGPGSTGQVGENGGLAECSGLLVISQSKDDHFDHCAESF